MELIDVTLPRRNTIEAVAVWEELEKGVLGVTSVPVAVRPNPPTSLQAVALPMPGIFYHLVEISTMLCEIADGSSHHADKLSKRFDRFKLIMEMQGLDIQKAIQTLSALVGVPDIAQGEVPGNVSVAREIARYAPGYLNSNDGSIQLARRVMDIIANRPPTRIQPDRILKERAEFGNFLHTLNSYAGSHIISSAYSDDLVLLVFLEASQYIKLDTVKISAIATSVIVRVARHTDLNALNELVLRIFNELARKQNVSLTVHFRAHNTVRLDGITSEVTLVVFINGRAHYCITFTNATPEEAPFHLAPENQRTTETTMYCSPAELAIQRKVAAALIDDYSIRAAIANQYEILKEFLPDI